MDTSNQIYEQEATGWQRGLYDDIQATFRAPIVNWIFRTLLANSPDFLLYTWGQVSPVFRTAGFAQYSVQYRDTVLLTVSANHDIPSYRRDDIEVPPAEYRELREQIATFDIVSPRLAVFFDLVYRALHEDPIGEDPAVDRTATAPFPAWLDADRGRTPSMVAIDNVPAEIEQTVDEILAFHGIDEGIPSIYRCLAQWPTLLSIQWEDLGPALQSTEFESACSQVNDLTESFVSSVPYHPRLAPSDLRRLNLADERIAGLQDLFSAFRYGGVETVLPALPLYAASVDAEGVRSFP